MVRDATREVLYDVHRTALADVLTLIERDVARTRIGTNGVAQVDTRRVVTAAFDHWDSRENDLNLHTHVVIANRVQGSDGRWRTLDSRAMHRAAVAMSERYDAILADHLTSRLGLDWQYRERGPNRNPAYELSAVPAALTQAFSRRSAAIGDEAGRLIEQYVAEHGHQPDAATVLRLRQQATLSTRGAKLAHSLADLTDHWRRRAQELLGADPTAWATCAVTAPPMAAAEAGPLVPTTAERVLVSLSRTRATWTAWNVDAEVSRALRAVRFGSAAERDRVTGELVDEVARRAVLLAAPELAATPGGLRRGDGASTAGASWLSSLPSQASPGPDTGVWRDAARTIAAYRERWAIDDPDRPLGTTPAAGTLQARERDQAVAVLARLTALEAQSRSDYERHRGIVTSGLTRPSP